jgi:hypothetical protein
MLLLGVVQAQAEAVSAGSYDLLQTEILTGSQASVTFSSLGDYAGTYQHLQIRALTRSTTGGTGSDYLYMQFNADTGSNYSWHHLQGNGSTVSSTAATSTQFVRTGFVPRSGSTASNFGAAVIDILDPFESSKYTTSRTLTGTLDGTNNVVILYSGNWRDLDALTSIKLYPEANSFAQYSRFGLYGLKGTA